MKIETVIRKVLVCWKGGRLREVVAREGWTVKRSLLFQTKPQGNV